MNTELHNLLDKTISDWLQLSFLKLININTIKDGDVLVFRSDEPIDREVLAGVRAYVLSLRPDLNKFGVMVLGIDEDVELVHQLTDKEI